MNPTGIRLKDAATVLMGQSPPGETYNHFRIGLPFFQGKAEFGEKHPTTAKWCSSPLRVAEGGDILLSVRAPVGPTNIASEPCCIGRGLAGIRARSEVMEQGYLWYFFKHVEPILSQRGQGSTFTAISRSEVEDLVVPLRTLSEQRRIVEILDQADALRKLRAEADAKAERILPALFVRMFGDPERNPKAWTTKPLAELVHCITSGSRGWSRHTGRGTGRFLRTQDVSNGTIAKDLLPIDPPRGGSIGRRSLAIVPLDTSWVLKNRPVPRPVCRDQPREPLVMQCTSSARGFVVHAFGFLSGSPNILTNSAGRIRSALASASARSFRSASAWSRISTMRRCSLSVRSGTTRSSTSLRLMAVNVLPWPRCERIGSTCLKKYHR